MFFHAFASTYFDKSILKNIIFVKLLALALTNLVLDLANQVTNLTKQSLSQPHH